MSSQPAPAEPLIPLDFLDAPSQRLFATSLYAIVQSHKLIQFGAFLSCSPSCPNAAYMLAKWVAIDALTMCILLPLLRIPKFKWAKSTRYALFAALALSDYAMFGQYDIKSLLSLFAPAFIKSFMDSQMAITEHKVRLPDVLDPSAHLLGLHTIRILPHATARLNPYQKTFCVSPVLSPSVSVPILFNNTSPKALQLSLSTADNETPFLLNLTSKELHSPHSLNVRKMQEEDIDYLDDSPAQVLAKLHLDYPKLQQTQSLYHIDLDRPGTYRLSRVLDDHDGDVKVSRTELQIVECPNLGFKASSQAVVPSKVKRSVAANTEPEVYCAGESIDLDAIVKGVPPLRMRWSRTINGKTEQFTIDGITPPADSSQIVLASPANRSHTAEISVPIPASLSTPGSHRYNLISVTDSLANSFSISELQDSQPAKLKALNIIGQRSLVVRSQPEAKFPDCGVANTASQGIKLLKGQSTALRTIISSKANGNGAQSDDGPWKATVEFEPIEGSGHQKWTRSFILKEKSSAVEVKQPGTYRLTSIQGEHCQGAVLLPSQCEVYEPPEPTISLDLTPINDECVGAVGAKASFVLSGQPPYILHYSITNLEKKRQVERKTKRVTGTRGEISLVPDAHGEWLYEFLHLDDANYRKISIDKSLKQVVHPLATAAFSNSKEQKVYSCEGDTIKTILDIKGTAPYKIRYQVSGESAVTVHKALTDSSELEISIPKRIAKSGGTFTVSLVDIEDGRGCKRSLTADDLTVDVRRAKPTVSFYGKKKERDVTVKAGDDVRLPLRLTGNAPWTIKYRHNNETPHQVTVNNPNGQLLVNEDGEYEILSVEDAMCPGVVQSGNSDYVVRHIALPRVDLANDLGPKASNGSIIRPPVCEGVPDALTLELAGKPPFIVNYDLIDEHNTRIPDTLQSVQKRLTVPLQTKHPGHRSYTFVSITDAVYADVPKTKTKHQLVRIEQDVLSRPTGSFNDASKIAPIFCMGDSFKDHTHEKTTSGSATRPPTLHLNGKAPFEVDLEVISEETHTSTKFNDLLIKKSAWILDLEHVFTSPGRHSVFLRRVKDATGCERTYARGSAKGISASIEVAEVASIASVLPQKDHCVGDAIDFVLSGTAPWTMKYSFNNEISTVSVKNARFSRIAEKAGVFRIDEVAHHQDSCRKRNVGILKTIHKLPMAKVRAGTSYIEDIKEGDQAEIVFNFEGTPPFSFEYTMSSLPDKHGKTHVLETHTITDVKEHSYSIFSNREGTWKVTAVTDAHCTFPPLSSSKKPGQKSIEY